MIELCVSVGKKFLDALTMPIINRDPDTGRKLRIFRVTGHDRTDTIGYALRLILQRFRQNESEFIAAITRRRVDSAAVNAQDVREAIEGVAADEMSVGIVDFLKAIEIEQQNGERPSVAIGALSFRFEDIEQASVVGKTGERVADGEVANLLEEAGIIDQSAAKSDGVAGDGERLRQDEGRIEQTLRLRGGKLRGEVHPGGNVDRTVEGGVLEFKAATIPD